MKIRWWLLSSVLAVTTAAQAQPPARPLVASLRFYASFDESADADFARGDRKIYTAPSLNGKQDAQPGLPPEVVSRVAGGRWGQALEFHRKAEQVVFFRGGDNVPYQPDGFSGTVSLWMSLDPEKDLEPGYVDPLQITDKTWNDASFFLDFTKDDQPRHFRLGVFSDYKFWNPQNRDWEAIPANERPMVAVTQPPFARDRWTHVAITWRDFNRQDPAEARLFLDGRPQPPLAGRQRMTWDPKQLLILLGIYYTGKLDELAIFDRALTADEIQGLARRETSLKSELPR